MTNNRSLIFIIFLVSTFTVRAELNEDVVLHSTRKHYPMVKEALENVEAAKMKVIASKGNFDLKLESKMDIRTRGFYDGKSGDVRAVKPLRFMNSEVYTGYRVSDGTYPDYEGKVDTLSEGEIRAGIKVSLWQNRDIDENRLQLWNNQLEEQIKDFKLQGTKLKAQKFAQKAYWTWFAYGHIYNVHKELLNIAIERDDAITKRIKRGDLARIYGSENRQYILKRSQKVIEAERNFYEASLYLSLFHRNKMGKPIIPEMEDLPKLSVNVKKIDVKNLSQDLKIMMERNPEMLSMRRQYLQLSNEERMGENKLAPKVDLSFEVSHDNGTGINTDRKSETLRPTENRAMLSVIIPIERRFGRGKINMARAKKRALEHRQQLFKDEMNVFINNIYKRISLAVDFVNNAVEEVKIAEVLRKAEQRKFYEGASDFFVVNIRDQNMADAKVRKIKAYLDFKKDMADYNEATMKYSLQ